MSGSRNEGIASVVRDKIMSPIGADGLHPREQLRHVAPVTVVNSGIPESMYILYTEAPAHPRGAPRTGRVLLSFDREGQMLVGGLFWYEDRDGVVKLQSAYLDPDFRGGRVMPMLMRRARKIGLRVAVGPMSTAGRKFVGRYQMKVEE